MKFCKRLKACRPVGGGGGGCTGCIHIPPGAKKLGTPDGIVN